MWKRRVRSWGSINPPCPGRAPRSLKIINWQESRGLSSEQWWKLFAAEHNRRTAAGLQAVMPLDDHPWADRGFAI
jgi:hypothetical protein